MENQNVPQQEQQASEVTQVAVAPAAPKQKGSGMGIASLVLGILAILIAFLPLINIVSVLLGIIGGVLAFVSLNNIKKGKADGKGVTTAGLVLCIVSLVISLVSLTMCGAILGSTSSSSSSSSSSDSSEQASEVAVDSDYAVTIDDTYVTTDYEGKQVLVVNYSWTNNSDDATSAAVALHEQAYQNGVELEHAYFIDGVDQGGDMNDVKPGSGTSYTKAYELSDDSDVTLEVTELISFSDALLASKTVSVA